MCHPFAFVGIKGLPTGKAFERIRAAPGYYFKKNE